ncbi:MAG: glutamine amidotransferase, partial [Steroidobacteraceae bacterium]
MTPSRLALAIRHIHFEDCGTLADVLRERGFEIRYVDAGRETLRELDVATPDLLIGLGGPVSVYEADRYPWITDELHLFERRLATRRPT